MAPKQPDMKTVGDMTLFRTGMMFDTVVHCQGVVWNLHRAILSSRCQWFKETIDIQPQGRDKITLHLNQFPKELLHTLLCYIYTSEIHHPRISDHRVLATLFNLSNHFKMPDLANEVVQAVSRHTRLILVYHSKGQPFNKEQLDQLFGAVRIAYNGDQAQQQSLRKVYMKLFDDCIDSVKRDPYFYDSMRSIPVFSVDMMENMAFAN